MAKPVVEIRRPRDDEWDPILDVLKTANFHRIGGTEMPEFPLSDCFVALVDDRVVGVAGYRILDETTAKTTLLAVDPAFRSLCVGTDLHRTRIQFLHDRGITTLYTNTDDERVVNWYIRHFGYRKTGDLIPKTEPFGRPDKDHWINLQVDL